VTCAKTGGAILAYDVLLCKELTFAVAVIAPASALFFWATVTNNATGLLSVCLNVRNVGVLWSNGWIDQDATWYGGRSRPGPHCVRWGGTQLPTRKGAQQPPPTFRLMSIAARRSPISATAELLFLMGTRTRPHRYPSPRPASPCVQCKLAHLYRSASAPG